eukprot:SAG22_NODE_4367_length_1291_cov_1.454698_1_plen_215_part_00
MATPGGLTDQQLWALDTQGVAVVPQVLTKCELAALDGVVSGADDSDAALAALADHPAIMRYAALLCASPETQASRPTADTAPRVDRAPRLLPPVATPTPLGGGNGRRDLGRAYFHLHGWDRWDGDNDAGAYDPASGFVGQKPVRIQITQGLLAIVALSDAPAGAEGLVVVPCSHNSEVETPPALASWQTDRLGMLRQPALQPGDLLLVLASTLQ